MSRVIVRGLALAVLLVAVTFVLDPFRNYQLALVAATFCATAGLTVLVGLTGQLSLGHAALMAAGGYGYALAAGLADGVLADGGAAGEGTSVARVLAGLAGAVVASGALGLLLGLAGARLRGPYLAGLTLALVVALPAATSVLGDVLGGDQGLRAPFEAVPPALERLVALEQWHAWIAVVVASAVGTGLVLLRDSRTGLHLRAAHGDETAARLSGVAVGRVKVLAFLASAVSAGLGGAVLAVVTQSVSPGAYGLAFSLLLVVGAVLGGLGRIGGAAAGAAVVVLLPWLIETATGAADLSADLEQRLSGNAPLLVFGALLVVVTLVLQHRPTPHTER